MNNKTLVIVLLICGLTLSALILRNGEPLIIAMPFLVYLIIGMIQAPDEILLTANRIISKAGVTAEEPFETRIVIRNQGSILVNLSLGDTLFPSITILEGKANHRLSLSAGESVELNYVSKAGRGIYSWKTIHAYASDPFGLFELERDIPAVGEIIVRPMPIRIRSTPFRSRSTLHAAGPITAGLAGSGTDFWGIREYRAGDPLRRINSRVTARHPHKLFTNEYEREEIADFGIILDARRITSDDAMEEALFEHAVSAAASLSENFLKKGNRVALLIYGESVTTLFPGYGKRQLNSILQNLAHVRLGANIPLGYLEYFPVRLFPSQSQIVMISTVDARDLEIYARLRAFGYDVLLISPDPVDHTARKLPKTEINAFAVRAARIERIALLKRLLKMGIEVIDWQVNESLETSIQRMAGHMRYRRNTQTLKS